MRHFTSPRLRQLLFAATFMAAGGLTTGAAMAYQGHMFNALHALQNARQQLLVATPDKGGYRDRAIDLVNQALGAVNAGIRYGAH